MIDRSWSKRFGTALAHRVHTPQSGRIFELARSAGIDVPPRGKKRAIRCPFHEDRHASAFVSERDVFYCSVCTPDGGWTAKRFAAAVGQPWGGTRHWARPAAAARPEEPPKFTTEDAQLAWSLALVRTGNDGCVDPDREVYDYLSGRGILEASELRAFGVLAEGMPVPESIGWWARAGYRIVAPLYDAHGGLVSIQARAITSRNPKTLFPKGSRVQGASFASEHALALLATDESEHDIVLLGEGLTDFLALSTATPIPVLGAPGTGFAASCIGPWVRGRALVLALDLDDAGEAAVHPAARAANAHGARDVLRVEWPSVCKDACDVVKLRGLAGLAALLARYLEVAGG